MICLWRQALLAACLVAASLATATPALAETEIPDSAAPYFQDPAFERAFEAEQQRLERLWERRTSPEGRQALADSASAYADLSAAEAIELATDAHAATLAEPAFDPLAGQPASAVEGYAGDYGAVVDVGGQQADALVESTLPLQAETPSGSLEAVDNRLEDHGAVLVPDNPLAELELPTQVSQSSADAIELPDIGVSVVPEGVEHTADAEIVAQRAFFASPWTDSDLALGAIPGGFEALYQLRSAESPESFGLRFELPAGAELVSAGPAAAIVSGDEELATIAPPAAWDADGFRVSVSYRVEGDELVTEVDHHGDDWAYPILVDPTVTESYLYWNDGTTNVSFAEWTYAENDADFGEYTQPAAGSNRGLYVLGGYPWNVPPYNTGGDYYFPYLSLGRWAFSAPGTESRIYKTTFANVLAASPLVNGQPFHWVMEGIAKPNGSWENGVTSAYGAASPLVQGGNLGSYQTIEHCLDAVAPYCRDYAGTNDNSAVIMSFANPGGYPPSGFYTFMGGAAVSIADTIAPIMGTLTHTYDDGSGVKSGLPSGWVDDVDLTFRSTARDLGLGINTFRLSVPGLPLQTRTVTCTGDRADRCPNTAYYSSHTTAQQNPDDYTTGHSFNYSTGEVAGDPPEVPEGVIEPTAWATDVLGNGAIKSQWQLKVDRSAPVVALSGPLKQGASGSDTLSNYSYELDINATDGVPSGSASQQRSGVQTIEVFVDGQSVYSSPQQACPVNSCPLSDEWVFYTQDYAAGEHTVQVISRDQLGHAGPSEVLRFRTAHPSFPDDDTDPGISLKAGPPAADGTYQLTITASDAESGVRGLELFVDGDSLNNFTQSCPGGGCSMTRTVTMQPSQSPTQHEIAVEVKDGAENSRLKFEGRMMTKPYNFGYNDDFATAEPEASRRLQQAIDGGADTVRFSIDWCSLAQVIEGAPTNPNPESPSTWRWWIYDPIFQKIRDVNSDPTSTNDLKVIAVLGDSPEWANFYSTYRATKCPIDGANSDSVWTPPGADHYSSWRAFVDKFLELYGAPQNGLFAIEAWNEPKLRKFWGQSSISASFYPEPEKFGHLVDRAAKSLKSYNDQHPEQPRIKLIPGGLSPDATEIDVGTFMQQAVSPTDDNLINPGEVDALSIHLYANRHRKTSKVKEKFLDKYTEMVSAFNQPTVALGGKPQWITEIGVPSRHGLPQGSLDPKKTNPTKQWHRLEWAYWEFSRHGRYPLIEGLLVHRLLDPSDSATEPNNFGVMDSGYRARLAYCMLISHESETNDPLLVPAECQ